jgi:glycosyltransferase involved in cell wall biosynthesis
MAAARNTGLDAATGDYIAFSDSDDYMQPDTFEIAYKEITKNDYDLAIFGVYNPEEHEKPSLKKNTQYTITIPEKHFLHEFDDTEHFTGIEVWNKLYKRSTIVSVKFDPELFGVDDLYFSLCIAHLIKKYIIINAKLYYWRQHANSCSKSRAMIEKIVDGYCKIVEKIYCSSKFSASPNNEQKLMLNCRLIAFLSARLVVNYGYDELLYASKRINDIYSRGFIDLSHPESFIEKIIVATFVIVGKVQNLFGFSK